MSLWSNPGSSASRFATGERGPERAEAVERIKSWTRGRFGLGDGDVIVVNEETPNEPGFPAFETHVAFWTADGTRHRYRVFRRVEQVEESDVPPAWMKERLANDPGFQCSCC